MTFARMLLRTTRRNAVAIVGMIALAGLAAGAGTLPQADETPEPAIVGWTVISLPCGIAGGAILLTGVVAILLYRRSRVLAASEERLRTALAAANQGLYDLNAQTGECVINPEYARMLGYDPETFHETNAAWRERLHPEDREAVYQVYQDYVAGRRAEYRVEFRQRTAAGDWKWILSCGEVVSRSADGRPLRMRGTHTDITDRKQVEEILRLQSSALAAAAHGSTRRSRPSRVILRRKSSVRIPACSSRASMTEVSTSGCGKRFAREKSGPASL